MSGFDPAWLALRERYDHAARDPELTVRFAEALGSAPELVDLGCGTGSNLRHLAPRLGQGQRWLCLDHDRALLEAGVLQIEAWAKAAGWAIGRQADAVEVSGPGFSIRAELRPWDLTRGLPDDIAAGAGLTAAALLDLTSARWLDALVHRNPGRPMLLTLSFDGRLNFQPAHEADREIADRFAAHQRIDKGLGPALGPDAAGYLAERLQKAGRRVTLRPSDWRLGPAARPLLQALLDGVISAARGVADDALLERWARVRSQQVGAGELHVTVGHLDLLALPG